MQRRDAVWCLRTRLESTGCSSGSFVWSVRATSMCGCARLVSNNTMTTSACPADVWVGGTCTRSKGSTAGGPPQVGVVLGNTAALSWGARLPTGTLSQPPPTFDRCSGDAFEPLLMSTVRTGIGLTPPIDICQRHSTISKLSNCRPGTSSPGLSRDKRMSASNSKPVGSS